MADQDVLRDFLVRIRFEQDEASRAAAEGKVSQFGSFLKKALAVAAVIKIGKEIDELADKFNSVGLAAHRAGMSIREWKAMGQAAEEVGLQAANVQGIMTNIANLRVRSEQGLFGQLATVGVSAKQSDSNEQLMEKLLEAGQKMPEQDWLLRTTPIFGDMTTARAMQDPAMLAGLKRHQALLAAGDHERGFKSAHDKQLSGNDLENASDNNKTAIGIPAIDAETKAIVLATQALQGLEKTTNKVEQGFDFVYKSTHKIASWMNNFGIKMPGVSGDSDIAGNNAEDNKISKKDYLSYFDEQDRFLKAIAGQESSGGKVSGYHYPNAPHDPGVYGAKTAWGKYGFTEATFKDAGAQIKENGRVDYDKITPEVEEQLARGWAQKALDKSNGDIREAARRWHDGINSPNRILPNETAAQRVEREKYPNQVFENYQRIRPASNKKTSTVDTVIDQFQESPAQKANDPVYKTTQFIGKKFTDWHILEAMAGAGRNVMAEKMAILNDERELKDKRLAQVKKIKNFSEEYAIKKENYHKERELKMQEANTNNTVTININGADAEKVKPAVIRALKEANMIDKRNSARVVQGATR